MITAQAKKSVKIEREADRAARTSADICQNQYHKDNVNVAQGPQTGNLGTPKKRGEFNTAKASREPVATMIQAAYVARAHEYKEFEYTNGGSIHDNTRASFKSKSKTLK